MNSIVSGRCNCSRHCRSSGLSSASSCCRSPKKYEIGTPRISAIAESREALTRLAPPSYFCTCWKVRPSALARVSWFIPSSRRRIRIRVPTCTSIGFGTPVPRPYLGVELGSSDAFEDFFNLGPLHTGSPQGCNGFTRSASNIRRMQASAATQLTLGRSGSLAMVNNVSDGDEASSTIFAVDLVISAPATDEDERHQPDAEPEGEDDPQRHGKPTCEADLRFADAGPQARKHDDHHQDCGGSDRHRDPIAQRSHRLLSLAVRGIMIRLPPPAAARRQSA